MAKEVSYAEPKLRKTGQNRRDTLVQITAAAAVFGNVGGKIFGEEMWVNELETRKQVKTRHLNYLSYAKRLQKNVN